MFSRVNIKNVKITFENPANILENEGSSQTRTLERGGSKWKFKLTSENRQYLLKIAARIDNQISWASQMKGHLKWRDSTIPIGLGDYNYIDGVVINIKDHIENSAEVWGSETSSLTLYLTMISHTWRYYDEAHSNSAFVVNDQTLFYKKEYFINVSQSLFEGDEEFEIEDPEFDSLDVALFLSTCHPTPLCLTDHNVCNIMHVAYMLDADIIVEKCAEFVKSSTGVSRHTKILIGDWYSIESLIRHCCSLFSSYQEIEDYLNEELSNEETDFEKTKSIMIEEGNKLFNNQV